MRECGIVADEQPRLTQGMKHFKEERYRDIMSKAVEKYVDTLYEAVSAGHGFLIGR